MEGQKNLVARNHQKIDLILDNQCVQIVRARSHIPGSWIMMRDVPCILFLEWSTTSQRCIGFLSPMHKKIPDSYSKREGGHPGNSGLSSQH